VPVRIDPSVYVGRSPESLSLAERQGLVGAWIALELYSPATTPLRRIEAIGGTIDECIAQLTARGLDARQYELLLLRPPGQDGRMAS
jgi:hypothetical protein